LRGHWVGGLGRLWGFCVTKRRERGSGADASSASRWRHRAVICVAVVAAVLSLGSGWVRADAPPPIPNPDACLPSGPINTVAPTLTSGSGPTGTTLTLNEGSWTPTCGEGIQSFNYAWFRDGSQFSSGSNAPPSTTKTYVTLNPDISHTITAVVTACDAFGDCNPANATGSYQVVCSVTNSVLPALTATGFHPPGGSVSTSAGTWSTTCQGARPNAPTVAETYLWSNGKTTQSITTGTSDVGHALTASVKATGTWTWSGGSVTENLTKTATGSYTVCGLTMNTAPAMTPSGNGTTSTTLHTTNGSWSLNPTSCTGTTSFSYQWQYATSSTGPWQAISGAPNSSTYSPPSLYIGDYIRVVVTASNPDTSPSTVTASGTLFVAPAPSNTVAPSISGTTSVGSVLTGSDGTWTTYGVSTTVSRRWQRCGYSATVLNDHPANYWRLGDSAGVTPTARDEQEGVDGTYSGSPTYGVSGALNGDVNNAVNFGGGSFIDLANPISFGSNDFTVEAWFNTSSAAANQQIWESDYTGTPAQPQDVSLALVNGKAQLKVEDASGATALVTSTSTYNNGAWHYIAAVRSGNTFSIYLDGTSVGSTTQTIGNLDVSGSIPRIGDGQTTNSNSHDSNFFGGSLDEVAVYGAALNTSQVTTHYNAGTNLTSSCVDIPGATGQTYTLTGADFGNKLRYDVTEANDDGGSPTSYTSLTNAVTDGAPSAPTAQPVASPIATLTPVLQATASDGDPLDYQFQVAKTSSPGTPIATSDWLPDTPNWTVPAGVLSNKGSYIFKVRVRDPYQDSAWSAASASFSINLPMLGSSGYWPMWSHGPVSVNEANGNLVLSLPTPSYPTAAGSLGFSLAYNSQATTGSNGLGAGWTLAAGDGATSPPVQLIDHSKDSTDPSPAAEIDWPDGSANFYTQVGSSDTYLPDSADGSQLTRNQDDSGWTLLASDGTTYTFGTESSGISRLSGAEAAAAKNGNGTFSYSFDASHRLSSLTFHQQPLDTGQTLQFNWACSGALFCVTGPDNKTWTYTANANNEITAVNDGTRQLLALSYNASGLPVELQNADDLDPTHASPGYNGQHSLQLTYSGNQVSCLIDGPISGQAASSQPACAGGGTASESTWSFNYAPGCPALQAPQAGHSLPQGTAAGCTTVTNPNQQPNGSGITVIYDSNGRPLELDDARLGSGSERITLEQYNSQNQLAWSEDADGNPTDYSYDPLNNVLTSTTAPRPGSGQARPVTTYRYDEQTIGTASQAGNPLNGLASSYWTNTNLAGQPVTQENDPDPSSSATNFSLPAGGMTWPPTAVGSGAFSARWTGDINIPASGNYTLTTVSDGSTRLTLGQNDLIENWTSPSSPFNSQPVYLSAGLQRLTLEYAHPSGGSANLTLKWSCADCNPAVSSTAVPLADLLPTWENQTSIVSPAGRVNFQHYLDPASGQPDYSLVKLSDGTNLISSSVYDSLGRVSKHYMPKANASATINATTGDLTGTPDTNYETDYTYYGDTATAAPPSDCGGGSAVDQYGQLESTTTPNSGLHSIVTVYNNAGQPIAVTNGKGTSCSVYTGEGRLTSETPHGDQTNPTNYTYDPNGTQLTTSNNSGTVTDVYNEAGQLTDTTDASGAEASYTYDQDGNQLKRTAATGPLASSTHYVTNYGYDAADQLTSETDPANNNYSFFYDHRGNLRGTQYPNGTFDWVDANPDGWISDQYNRHGTITAATSTPPADSNPISDFSYTYDADGKRLSETRISGSTSQTTGYSYDNAGRLNQTTLPSGSCRNYKYDLDSNRIEFDSYTGACTGAFTATFYNYDPTAPASPGVDELTKITVGPNTTTYSYTSDGQTSSQGTTSDTWDGWGRISTATVGSNEVTYKYDPAGTLMSRASSLPSSTTNYLLGDLIETDGNGNITTSYADGPAGDLASYNGPPTSSSTPTYLYYDAHGNLTAEVTSGSQTGNHTYDPFGAPTDAVPANTTVHRFTGRWDKQYDTTTGLVLMGARPYDPNTGRFLAVDPVPGGSLNNYDYTGQDPINGYDLNGTCWTGFCWAKHAAEDVGHGVAVGGKAAARVFSHIRWKKVGGGLWELHDTLILAGAGAAITFGCFFTDAASGGLATAVIAVPCGVAIGTAGVAAFLTGRQMVRDFKKAYRR
jgi:RHS repeat-associated protein